MSREYLTRKMLHVSTAHCPLQAGYEEQRGASPMSRVPLFFKVA